MGYGMMTVKAAEKNAALCIYILIEGQHVVL